MLAVGTLHGRVLLVDAATGMTRWEVQIKRNVEIHREDVHIAGWVQSSTIMAVAMAPDGRFVASVADSEESWKLLDAASGLVCMTGARHDGTGDCSCNVIKRGGEKGRRKTLDAGCTVRAHTAALVTVAFSPCGQRLATGGKDYTIILWDVQTGRADLVLQGHTALVRSISFSANGERLASGSWDRSIRIWESRTGALLRAIPNAHAVSSVHFSPMDIRRLTSADNASTAKQWDVVSGEMVGTVEGHGFAQFSPDGQTIATVEHFPDHTSDVLLVDAETGAVRLRLVGHAFEVHTAWWSVDGSKLASASQDGACKVWDSSTGALLRTFDIGGWICSMSWGRDWVLEKQKVVAFLMGHHPRLGAGSQVLGLDEELLRMILDRV